MSLLHPDPPKKNGRKTKKKASENRNRGLPARRHLGAYASGTSRAKRAGLRALKGKSPKTLRNERLRKKKAVRKKPAFDFPVIKKDARLFQLGPVLTPIEFFDALAAILAKSGLSFADMKPTEKRFAKAIESIPDNRHHARLRIQAGPHHLYCRIMFDDARDFISSDEMLCEYEDWLQRHCGFEFDYPAAAVLPTPDEVARWIITQFGAYVLGRARLTLLSREFREALPQIAREAMELTYPRSDS